MEDSHKGHLTPEVGMWIFNNSCYWFEVGTHDGSYSVTRGSIGEAQVCHDSDNVLKKKS